MDKRNGPSDWKYFKKVGERALERLCERALNQVVEVASDSSATHHERYLKVFRIIRERNDEIAHGFDDMRRSKMIEHIVCWRQLEIITHEEMAGFGQETQEEVAIFLRLQR